MSEPFRVVYDCNVFIQALININGPAGRCIRLALNRDVALCLSDQVLNEIRRAPTKPTPARLGVTIERTEALVDDLLKVAVVLHQVREEFSLARDPDDAHYVNLAQAASASCIVSRDKDLTSLMDGSRPEGADFLRRYPELRVVDPVEFLRSLKSN